VIATSLPGYLDDGRWPSRLLAQFVDNNAALTYLPLLPFLPPLTLNGMAYALHVDDLDRLGGFAPLLGYLTDDLAMAERVLAAGGRIEQIAEPHGVETTVRDGRHYLQLMHRWYVFALLLLRKQRIGLAALIGLLNGLPPALLLALVVRTVAAPNAASLAVLLAVLVCRGFGLVLLQRTVYGRPLHSPLTSLASELVQPAHLLQAMVWRRIVWRKRRYRVRSDHHFENVS
jgi:ceramide glucosyltransferase